MKLRCGEPNRRDTGYSARLDGITGRLLGSVLESILDILPLDTHMAASVALTGASSATPHIVALRALTRAFFPMLLATSAPFLALVRIFSQDFMLAEPRLEFGKLCSQRVFPGIFALSGAFNTDTLWLRTFPRRNSSIACGPVFRTERGTVRR